MPGLTAPKIEGKFSLRASTTGIFFKILKVIVTVQQRDMSQCRGLYRYPYMVKKLTVT
jgi:hypothetical protein